MPILFPEYGERYDNMNVKQNRLFKAALCALATACALSWLTAAGPAEQLPENILRLHVVANSDSEADQSLKLKVRDAVLNEAARWCQGADSLYEANAAVCTHLEGITEAARGAVKENGFTDAVTVTVTDEFLHTREYEGFTLPAGRYRTLRVVIGEGSGHNWWCVVCPALCLPAAQGEDVLAELPPEQREAVRDKGLQVSFKLAELYEELKNWLAPGA